MEKKEYILCAAIHYEDGVKYDNQPDNVEAGYVVCGRRHHNCIFTNWKLSGKRNAEFSKVTQGFMTSFDRFVDRAEALKIAKFNNQILDLNEVRGKHLYSEDLY